ncbi:MAG: lipoyl(octanoyl) transferase LipB [Pseudomonadota bacterium]
MLSTQQVIVRDFGPCDYTPVWQAMQKFTQQRAITTADEIWLVEHHPVFTQGQAGKPEHLLAPANIPVIQVDRGGQVTYHGPGQQVVYCLFDLKRKQLGVREMVTAMERAIVETLRHFAIEAAPRADAPGVYVGSEKICSLGFRVSRGCSYHGIALNIDMDMEPFLRINPCGYAGMAMTQMRQLNSNATMDSVQPILLEKIIQHFSIEEILWQDNEWVKFHLGH